jgi:hypothetical protein
MESTAAHDKTPNWLAFRESMQDIGLKSIEGLPEDLIEWLRLESRGSELLNIDDEQDAFVEVRIPRHPGHRSALMADSIPR